MGIDFDENGKNEEYEADETEPTGEPGDQGRPRNHRPDVSAAMAAAPAPVTIPTAGVDANTLVAAIMGVPTALQQAQAATTPVLTSEDDYMTQVEKRLEIVSYYRLLLRDSLFENDSEAAQIVDNEVRTFIRERVSTLLGMPDGSPAKQKEPDFTPEQMEVLKLLGALSPEHVTALKLIAAKVVGTTPPPAPPRAGPAAAAPRPAPKPAPVAPTIAKRAPPPGATPAPSSTQPAAPPTREQRRPGPGRTPGSKGTPKLTEMVPAIRKHADGTEEQLFHPKTGEPIMVAVQRRQKPAGALPFPNETQMTQVTQIQAAERAAKLENNPEARRALTGIANSQ